MARRSSSLNNVSVAVSREIGSKYDNVKLVADNIAAVMAVSQEDLPALIAALEEATDFTGITVVSGTSAGWNSTTKVLTVPTVKGDKGDSGVDGSVGATGDKGAQGLRGATGPQGVQGIQGIKGNTGAVGPAGATGTKGDTGNDLTVNQVISEGNGVFTFQFSDGTNYTTPSLIGPQGIQGQQGIVGDAGVSVNHLKGTSTTDPEGDFGTFGELDTYTFYGDSAETLNLGHFTIRNGVTADEVDGLGIMRRTAYDADGTGIVDNSEKLGGKSLTTIESERTAEITTAKLALGTNYTVADNVARLALADLTVGDKVFVSDNGDTKWAQYWVVAVTDGAGSTSTFAVVMDEDTYLNANTATSVKSTYENNADTNAFTDADKTSVNIGTPLDTEATTLPTAINELYLEVTTHTDSTTGVHGVSGILVGTSDTQTLTNKTVNLSNNTLVATSAQLASALTDETGTGKIVFNSSPTFTGTVNGITKSMVGLGNVDNTSAADLRSRATHTGTQTAATISDFDAEVANNNAVAANTAKVTNVTTDLSTTTSASSVTVNSSDGANALLPAATSTVAGVQTGADKAKLDGIEVLADVTDTVNVTSAGALMRTGGAVTGPISTTSTVDGRNVSVDGTKLDTIATSANNYTHPTVDGSKHVPVTGTTNNGKVLTAGATAGTFSWETPTDGVYDHTLLSNIGANTHGQIDTALTRLVGTSGTNTGDQTNISGNAGTASVATNSIKLSGSGAKIVGAAATSSYTGAVQVREAGEAGAGSGLNVEEPRLAFHWLGRIASSISMQASGRIAIRDNPGTGYGALATGNLEVTGTLTETSDVRVKTDIENIENALYKVQQINGVTYNRTDIESDRKVGVIAQEVEVVLPEAVNTDEDGNKSVAYGNMVGLLIEAIKEQQTQIEELKKLIL